MARLRLFTLAAIAACLWASAGLAQLSSTADYGTFPPQHAYTGLVETSCANGAETTAGDSNGFFRPAATSGAGAIQNLTSTSIMGTTSGLCEFISSTTVAATNTGLVTQAALMNLANGTARFSAIFYEHTLSDGTNTYVLRIGLQDTTSTTDPTDGCYFLYSHSINSAKWLLVSHSNSSGGTNGTGGSNESTADSGLTFTDGTYRQFGIIATTASCIFLNNGVQVGTTLSTNVPSGSSRLTGAGIVFTKSSATATNTVPLYLDYMAVLPAQARPAWVPF